MGDIDFDELDKAVNSLMSSNDAPREHKKTTNTHASKAASMRRRHTPVSSRASVTTSPVKVMDMRSLPPKSPKSAPAIRRTGRFMDVVDSSSELNPIRKPLVASPRETMRMREQPTTEPSLPAAQAAPVLSDVSSSSIETILPATQPEKVTATEQESEPVQVRLVAKSAPIPDPLQLVNENATGSTVEIVSDNYESDEIRPAAVFGSSPTVSTEQDNQPITVTVQPKSPRVEPLIIPSRPQEDPVNITTQSEQTIQSAEPELSSLELATESAAIEESEAKASLENESPFLVDTKVDKRPLNANPTATIEPTEALSFESEQMAVPEQSEDATDLMPTIPHEQPEVSQVPELSSELVALEATGKSEYELDEPPVPIKSSTDGSQISKSPKKQAVVGLTSISQQYQSKESSGDTSHAPIYNASEYADPVAHPAKKKSGWIWVLVILLILAIGSGGAVALYLSGIIP